MRFRRNPLPRRLLDILCFFLVGVLMPLGCLYEIASVLPAVHAPGSFLYNFTFLMVMFLFLNAMGNLIACMIVDTSVDHCDQIPSEYAIKLLEWRHCTICNQLAPPRSWHCKLCGVCILKRDHHCLFTGCCIGHQNYRYFMCFLLYVFVGSMYGVVYNVIYMWYINADMFGNWFLQAIPFRSLVLRCDFWTGLQLLVYNLNLILLAIVFVTLVYHVPHMLRGQVCYKSAKDSKYNNGIINNLRSVFGRRMHVAWLFPLVKSQLPDDGYSWMCRKAYRDI